jgi:hypothetical protein
MFEILYSKKNEEYILRDKAIINSEYVYCPSCRKSNKLDGMSNEYECETFDVAEFKCAHCGEVHYVKLRQWRTNKSLLMRKINEKKYAAKAIDYAPMSSPSYIKTDEMIVVDREEGKLSIFVRFLNIITAKTHYVVEPYYEKYIINYKNHTAYIVKGRTYNGTKTFGYNGTPLINATNYRCGLWSSHIGFHHLSTELLENFVQFYFQEANVPMYDDLVQKMKDDLLNKHDSSTLSYKAMMFELVMAMNKCPSLLLDYDAYTQSFSMSKVGNKPFFSKAFIKYFPKTIVDKQELIRTIARTYDVPCSPSFWKLYLNDITMLDKAIYFKQCGFNNPDVIRMLITNNTFFEDAMEQRCTSFDIKEIINVADKFRQIVKKMVANSDELVVAKRFLTTQVYWYISDTLNMYNKVKAHDTKLLDTINWSSSLKEIHDDLSLIIDKIKYANAEIKYTNREKHLENSIDGYTFKLAVDTNELVAIGQEMKICVGSYREQAISKQSLIISIRDDSKYVGCIELDNSFGLRQIKGNRNSYLIGEVGNAAIKWVKTSGVKDYNRNVDFTHIGQQSLQKIDFHTLELDENGNVYNIRPQNDQRWIDDYAELPF